MKALHYNVTGQDRKELVGIISKVVRQLLALK